MLWYIPRISFLPCTSLQRAMNTINPLESVSDNGLSLYVRAIEMCGSHLDILNVKMLNTINKALD